MRTHLPPSFACSKCPKKYVLAWNFKNHLKMHEGILNEVCKVCNKSYSTKGGLRNHIARQHFSKLHCEVPNCSYKCGSKPTLKIHLERYHQYSDKNLIKNLLEDLEKLKLDFKKMKYA